ncbi:DUF4198 domain-containing protein [Cohnella sp.]|uniref:DUF4198 domain-containing protein n=1 Tax=Cohnella sp. TaxID=1883426 RepID=UPI003563AA40
MRKMTFLAAILFLISCPLVFAAPHNGWSQTNVPILETGQQSYVDLFFGNHSDNHTSYRIDRKWELKDSKVEVLNPAGEIIDITNQFYYMGELEEVDQERIGVNNYYTGSFRTTANGAYIIAAEGNFTYGDQTQPTLRSAKSFVGASKIPTFKEARKITGFDRHITPDRAELVPLFNPSALKPGEKVTAQLLLMGRPVPDIEVAVIRRSDSSDLLMRTDREGKVTWTAEKPDYYLVRAEIEAQKHNLNNYDYEATMTYIVQH